MRYINRHIDIDTDVAVPKQPSGFFENQAHVLQAQACRIAASNLRLSSISIIGISDHHSYTVVDCRRPSYSSHCCSCLERLATSHHICAVPSSFLRLPQPCHDCSSASTLSSSKVPRWLLRASLPSFRPPTSPFGQPSQTEYSAVSSQCIWYLRAFSVDDPTVWNSLLHCVILI